MDLHPQFTFLGQKKETFDLTSRGEVMGQMLGRQQTAGLVSICSSCVGEDVLGRHPDHCHTTWLRFLQI